MLLQSYNILHICLLYVLCKHKSSIKIKLSSIKCQYNYFCSGDVKWMSCGLSQTIFLFIGEEMPHCDADRRLVSHFRENKGHWELCWQPKDHRQLESGIRTNGERILTRQRSIFAVIASRHWSRTRPIVYTDDPMCLMSPQQYILP